VQFDERGDKKNYEATRARVRKGEGGSWALLPTSFIAERKVLKGGLLVGRAPTDLTGLGNPELLSDVEEIISTHSARETAVQEEAAGRNKRKGRMENGGGGQAEAAPRA
jgi:hypothetical protein